jgi:aspartate aminotransferase
MSLRCGSANPTCPRRNSSAMPPPRRSPRARPSTSPNPGIPELRSALADYTNRLYGTHLTLHNVIVSASGMNALMLVMQSLVDPGDVVVTTTPAWPNLPAVPRILTGAIREVPLQPSNAGWRLHLDCLFDACDARTRVIFLNSPTIRPAG